eukprot:TRINITY_DN37130_c0_g1_i1.p1 TRINITY_DN37130_c0_g1~~TRINITY_DN37130_c0_g1_i1.p1  ORF type:complete len:254 (+),score=37.10 TRINITY_DN37130_c0_g1_i1:53-763(+)
MLEKQIRYTRDQLYNLRPPLEAEKIAFNEKVFSEWWAKGVAAPERRSHKGKGRGLGVLLATNPGIKGFSAGRGRPESVSSASSCGPVSSTSDSPVIEASQPPPSNSSTVGSEIAPPTPPRTDGLNPNANSFNPSSEKQLAASMAYLSARPRVPTAMRPTPSAHGFPSGYGRSSARAPPPTCMQGYYNSPTYHQRARGGYSSGGYPPYSTGYGSYSGGSYGGYRNAPPPTAINLSGI